MNINFPLLWKLKPSPFTGISLTAFECKLNLLFYVILHSEFLIWLYPRCETCKYDNRNSIFASSFVDKVNGWQRRMGKGTGKRRICPTSAVCSFSTGNIPTLRFNKQLNYKLRSRHYWLKACPTYLCPVSLSVLVLPRL